MKKRAPVDEKKQGHNRNTEDDDGDSFQAKGAVDYVSEVIHGIDACDNHQRIAQHFSAEERRNGSHSLYFGEGGGDEEGGRGEGRQCVNENDEPTMP